MNDSFEQLVKDVWRYEEEVYPNEPDYEAMFGARVRALGERELLLYLFRAHADSSLRVLLRMLDFAWRDVRYGTWLQILEEIADSRFHLYQLLFFMSDTLAIDIRCLPSSHPNVQAELRSSWFRDGVPGPKSKALREALGDTFDYHSLWKRLAAEGAPLLKIPYEV